MKQTTLENYDYWSAKREAQKHIVWYSTSTSRNSKVAIKVVEMTDEHLLNTIKIVYDCAKRAEDLKFIEELQEYENVKYIEWLQVLSCEYKYRKATKNLLLESKERLAIDFKDYLNNEGEIDLDRLEF